MVAVTPPWESLRSFAADPLLASIRPPLLQLLDRYDHFPTVEELDAVLSPASGVHFVRQPPAPRRARPLPAAERYNGQIALHRRVPTRPNSLHDLLNALVWAAFPLSKMELHRRQHRAQGTMGETPGMWVRTREQDSLSIVDEAGFLWVTTEPERAMEALTAGAVPQEALTLFGHALAEHVILGKAGRGMVVVVQADADADRSLEKHLLNPLHLQEPVPWPGVMVNGTISPARVSG